MRRRNVPQRSARRAARPGMVLLEVIVAMTILAVGGASLVALASASLDAVRRAYAAEEDATRASAFLDAVALWPRADLDRHLGSRAEGPWRLEIERPEPTLYEVSVSDSAHDHPIVATALYRPEVAHAAP
ncbi:MAG TPA: type II secretion system protein [Gemmatimonadaceae bacterium]|nr:type II secretion system protein [Gemmatimonadaceae bacterium]